LTGQIAAPGVLVPAVVIESADVATDTIRITLSAPPTTSGTLRLALNGPSGEHVIREEARAVGTHNETFNIAGLPSREFTEVSATWTAAGETPQFTFAYHIKVLGDFNNTRYNTPAESYCSGDLLAGSYTSGTCQIIQSCDFGAFQGKSEWWSEVAENGSGVSESLGVVSRESFCTGPERRVRRVPAPCSQCGGSLTAGVSVARNVNNLDLPCGAQVYVHQVGMVTVADSGGGLATTQLDHYAGASGCNQTAGTIGVRKVIRIFTE
jgi:3D (Asp-Asp-Asp) domain-containing protein